ncbi:MAG: hypothetical protein P4M00_15115 [Azospirillaceae bacterium]|nr:hypothetical protein [Azospirillaceae bacterium]
MGILGYDSDDDLALIEDGSQHRDLYFVLIDRNRFRVDAKGIVVDSGLVFRDGELFFVEFPIGVRIDYLVNYNEEPLQGKLLNIPVTVLPWVRDYPFRKDLTSDVLRRAGLLVPRDLSLILTRTLAGGAKTVVNHGHNPRMDARRLTMGSVVTLDRDSVALKPPQGVLAAFLAEQGCDHGVLKPNQGGCGEDVHFFSARNLAETEAVLSAFLCGGSDVLIQERIVPPLVMAGCRRLDWILRVFVTRDRRGRAVVPDMIACMGEEGGAINLTLGAEALLLEEIAQLLAWDRATLTHVRAQVSAVSARAYQAMCAAITRDAPSEVRTGPSAPDILGLDVIVRRQGTGWQVYVIEMDVNPGGAWYLNHRLRTVSRAGSGPGDLSRESLDARIGSVNHAWIRLIRDRCQGNVAKGNGAPGNGVGADYDCAAAGVS